MSALPNDIAAATREAIIERYENTAVRDALTGARDGSLQPAEGFFDLLANAKTIVDERGLVLSGDPRFSVSVAALVWSDPTVSTPAVRLVDTEQSVDAKLCCSRIELDLEDEVTSFELFYAPDVDLTPPPTGPAPLRIAPVASGSADGSSWENAAPLSDLNRLIGIASITGAEVWIRADAGVYNQTGVISLSRGGCVVRGVDVNGNDMKAEFVGNRASPWSKGAAYGNEMFRLNRGADNLTMKFLRGRNVGAGFIRMREPATNLTFTDIDCINVGRGIVNYANGTADASVTNVTIQRLTILGFSKHGIAFRHGSSNILIEDCDLDSQNIDKDFITCGVQLEDEASNGMVRRVSVRNVFNTGPDAYYNGDAFSGEWRNANWTYEDCYAENISDGGGDFKGNGLLFVRFRTKKCKRSLRIWGQADIIDLYSETPTTRGGTGATCHVFAMQLGKARVRIQGGTFIQANANPIFRVDNSGLIAWDAAAAAGVQASAGYTMCVSEADDVSDSLFGVWNHADTVAPTITTNLAFAIDENKPGTWRIAVSELATLRIRGADAAKFYIIGRELKMYAQDYEQAGGPAADGTNVLKLEMQAVDVNGNPSAWYPLSVTINDVGDDPISPAGMVSETGATGGYIIDVSRADSLFIDAARTIPAIEGSLVKAVTDLSGFGNHWIFPDGYEPVLRVVAGYRALDFNGQVVANVGAPGGLRFPQFTAFAVVRRNKEVVDGTFNLFFTARRSKAAATSDNAAFRFGFLDTSTAQFKIDPNSGVSIKDAAPLDKPLVVSLRSSDAILRSGYNQNGMGQRLDGADVAAARYTVTDDQPLFGAAYNGTDYYNFFSGLVFFAAQLNVPVPDAIRSRIELQGAAAAGAL